MKNALANAKAFKEFVMKVFGNVIPNNGK